MKIGQGSGSRDWEPHPSGPFPGRLTRIIDLGTQEDQFEGKVKHVRQVRLSFETAALMTEGEFAGKPFLISKTFTASMGEKATLRKQLESWRSRTFTSQELETFDLRSALGKPCLLNVIHKEGRDGRVRANIGALLPLPPGSVAPATGQTVYFSMYDDEFDQDVFDSLSDYLKDIIKKSPEYQQVSRPKRHAPDRTPAGVEDSNGGGAFSDMDDDVPW